MATRTDARTTLQTSVETEREQHRLAQAQLAGCLVIDGIPEGVGDLRGEVVNILAALDVSVNESDLLHVRKEGRRHRVVCQFAEHASVQEVLLKHSGHKDQHVVGGRRVKLYFKQMLTPHYEHLSYAIREAKKRGRIFRYRIENGVNAVQLAEGDDFQEITHKSDLINMGLYLGQEGGEGDTGERDPAAKITVERERLLKQQKSRRNSVAIRGIPGDIDDVKLQVEVLRIVQTIQPSVHKSDILRVFRIGPNVICTFLNEDIAVDVLRKGAALSQNDEIGGSSSKIHFEPSFIREYARLFVLLREAKRDGKIFDCRFTDIGINQIQMSSGADFHDITHHSDLERFGLQLDDETEAAVSSNNKNNNDISPVEEERERLKQLQAQRRNSVVIRGVPEYSKGDALKYDVVQILQTIVPSIADVHVSEVFRAGPLVVCKFMDQEVAMEVLLHSKILAGAKSNVFVEPSLIREYAHLNYLIRMAHDNGRVFAYRIRDGVNQLKLKEEDEEFTDITHKTDLIKLGLYAE